MSARFADRSRLIIYGVAGVSFIGAAVSFLHHTLLSSAPDDPLSGPGISISRSLSKGDPATHLNASAAPLFAENGKQDRADFVAQQAALARQSDNESREITGATSARPDRAEAPVQFVAAALTPVDMGRAGPTRNAELFRQSVNRGGKGDRLESTAAIVRKTAFDPLGEPANGVSGVSAALFLLGPSFNQDASASSAGERFSESEGKQINKSTWAEMIKMARVTGGDGRKIESGMFGALTEDEFRAREFRCMATAIYFEARGESIKGQTAVAQVVMTRVRSDYYPNTICGVVYQGQWNRNACQFSFACDGKTDAPKNRKQWDTAIDVAKKVISGQAYVKDVGAATHYHATYVSPRWRRMMNRVTRIGVHIFYKADFVRPLVASTDLEGL